MTSEELLQMMKKADDSIRKGDFGDVIVARQDIWAYGVGDVDDNDEEA